MQLAGLAIAADRPIDGRLGPDVREQKWSPSTRGSHSIWCANVSVILKKSGDKYLLAWRRCDSKVPYGPILMSEEWSKY